MPCEPSVVHMHGCSAVHIHVAHHNVASATTNESSSIAVNKCIVYNLIAAHLLNDSVRGRDANLIKYFKIPLVSIKELWF